MRTAAALLGASLALSTAALAEVTPLDLQRNHLNGSILIVRGLEVGADAIRVDVTVTTADREIKLANNGSMILVDDQSGVYRLIPPPDNEELTVPANSRLTGELYFSGRLDPSAQRLVLTTNDGSGGSADNRSTSMPLFRVELPVPEGDGDAAAGAAAGQAAVAGAPPVAEPAGNRRFAVNAQAQHENGTSLIVDGIEATGDAILLGIRVTTAGKEIQLNNGGRTELVDDQGNVHRMVPPPENPELDVPAGSRIAGQIAFSGRLSPGATRLTLVVNERFGGQSRYTSTPKFRLTLPLEG